MTKRIIDEYAAIARPIMLQWMTRESCISAVRLTLETMQLFGLRAVAHPVCFALQVPARKYARICGFPPDKLEEIKAKSESWINLADGGWQGHLVAVVEDRWILDPSIDQAQSLEFGVPINPMVMVMDAAGHEADLKKNLEIKIGLALDSGDEGTLNYRSIEDDGYLRTEAWSDEGLPILAGVIAAKITNRLTLNCPN
jgi:hypothetical protein